MGGEDGRVEVEIETYSKNQPEPTTGALLHLSDDSTPFLSPNQEIIRPLETEFWREFRCRFPRGVVIEQEFFGCFQGCESE